MAPDLGTDLLHDDAARFLTQCVRRSGEASAESEKESPPATADTLLFKLSRFAGSGTLLQVKVEPALARSTGITNNASRCAGESISRRRHAIPPIGVPSWFSCERALKGVKPSPDARRKGVRHQQPFLPPFSGPTELGTLQNACHARSSRGGEGSALRKHFAHGETGEQC